MKDTKTREMTIFYEEPDEPSRWVNFRCYHQDTETRLQHWIFTIPEYNVNAAAVCINDEH